MKKIGIILDLAIMQNAIRGRESYEHIEQYVVTGKKLGMEPVFFHPTDVNFHKGTVRGYVWKESKLKPKRCPIPAVMHNRVLSGNPRVRSDLKRLSKKGKMFNGIVVRNKERVHHLFWKNPELRKYLPETARFSQSTMRAMLDRYPLIYVKPAIGSVGIGVVRIERQGDRFHFFSSKKRRVYTRARLEAELMKWVGGRRFLIQQGISLATYDGRTFDIRVSVQKDGTREWRVSGMVAKVANPKNKLSNLSRGGEAVAIDKVLARLFDEDTIQKVKEQIEHAAIRLARQYGRHFSSLADLGLDMGIDKKGNPYLIEANVRDQRYSFYKAGEWEMFKRTYSTPLEYARTLYKH